MNKPDTDHKDKELPSLGMSTCGVLAALGRPEAVNHTKTASADSAQLVYRSRRLYVYTRGHGGNQTVYSLQHQ